MTTVIPSSTPMMSLMASINSSLLYPRICLNMIVKNESKIITRLLDSVMPIIDSYCICDTGSTDDTVSIIETYFNKRGVPGKIVYEPFRDFGYNRTFALEACNDIHAEYILLLDADMIFWVNPQLNVMEFKRSLKQDYYTLFQGSETYYYLNTRLVKNNRGFTYWGVTHEYVKAPPENVTQSKIDKNILFINDIGDGGSKQDKFLRDIRLLEKGLEELPNNDRYLFYLANSYRDSQQYEKAIETYKKRIQVGGWIEEIWYSHYSIGKCWKLLGDMNYAITAWMDAYQAFPNRIENLYEIIQHYRYVGKNQLAYVFYMVADRMRKQHTQRDYLFMHCDVYDYKIDYELSILGYYVNLDNHDLKLVSMKVLSNPNVEHSIMNMTLSNYKFYSKKMSTLQNVDFLQKNNLGEILQTIGTDILRENPEFVSSTPSFVYHREENAFYVNVRLVNYKIKEDGSYWNPGKIITINVLAKLELQSEKWVKTREQVLKYDESADDRYVGLEDVRLYWKDNNILGYNANRGIPDNTMVVENGIIDLNEAEWETENDVFLEMEGQNNKIEKNWVNFPQTSGNTKMVYSWSPLILGELDNATGNVMKIVHKYTNVPPFFKHLRGSCHGILHPVTGENWFLCHLVSYEYRRYYYHIIVALDRVTGELLRYTQLFTLEGQKVEYVLGFSNVSDNGDFMLSYSVMDSETKYMVLKNDVLESLFYNK